MKTNKETLQTIIDRRLSFLDDLPSCRGTVQARIAQEEEPVMKKKVSLSLVLAMVLIMLSVAALAAGLLLSPRVTATQTADQAMEKERGITTAMMTFFGRHEKELPDGSVQVIYSGVGSLKSVLGTYTVLVKNGSAEISWSLDGKDQSNGYESEAWGSEQLTQMLADCLDPEKKEAFLLRAEAAAEKQGTLEPDISSPADEKWAGLMASQGKSAMEARKLSEEEMVAIGREFIIRYYGLNEEQIALLELYTQCGESENNVWYMTVNGKPCFQVEYLLYAPFTEEQELAGETRPHIDKEGYYNVFVNVETGVVEEYEYNSGLGGIG